MKSRTVIQCFLIVQVLFLVPAFSFARGGGKVKIIIGPVFNGAPLKLGEQTLLDQNGDTLSIDLFKFYMTHIALQKATSKTAVLCKTCDHLFDTDDSSSYTFTIDIPDGSYDRLSFVLGVDSIANTSGANSGDLDPVKGMYWAWNTGYIMAKVEGHSTVCKTLHHAYEFHIGGYMPPNNTSRTIDLDLASPLAVKKGQLAQIIIKADVAAWFQGVDLAELNSIVIPGKQAMQMADRYAKMFSVR